MTANNPGTFVAPGRALRNAGFALGTALAAVLLMSCAGRAPVARNGSAALSEEGQGTKDLARAEQRVERSPREAAARAALAQAYLSAGRFDSASTAFADAITLGDQNPRTALGASLAYIGAGRNAEALALLEHLRDRVSATDYGLAIALAGQPAVGVAVLTETVRGGGNTPKARQNLAYAYALDGRWNEARLIASQDVPADQIDARMAEWAGAARPDNARARVAGLLGAPLRGDPGLPERLALDTPASDARLAKAEVPAPATEALAEELPAVRTGESFWGASSAQAEDRSIAPAHPAAPVRMAGRSVAAPKVAVAAKMRTARVEIPASRANHLVQLGSFRSMDSARRAWGTFVARNPALKGHGLRITQAKVNGQIFFRVAADGFDQTTARSVCSGLRQSGNPCLAYAQQRPLPGAVATSQVHRAEL